MTKPITQLVHEGSECGFRESRDWDGSVALRQVFDLGGVGHGVHFVQQGKSGNMSQIEIMEELFNGEELFLGSWA